MNDDVHGVTMTCIQCWRQCKADAIHIPGSLIRAGLAGSCPQTFWPITHDLVSEYNHAYDHRPLRPMKQNYPSIPTCRRSRSSLLLQRMGATAWSIGAFAQVLDHLAAGSYSISLARYRQESKTISPSRQFRY